MTGGLSAAEAALENQKIGSLQLRVALLCALAQAFDGYDIGTIGMAVPSLIHAWGLPAADFSRAFVMSSIGILVGALSSGPLGDRIGRKPLLIASVAFIGVFSLLSAYATSLPMLVTLRFLTGIGIGGAMPATVALTSDYTPQKYRGSFIMFMFTGNTLGGFIGGQIVAQILPQYGWQAIFLMGGVPPLVLVPLLMLFLPESARFLLARGRGKPRELRLLDRLGIAAQAATARAEPPAVDVHRGNPVLSLFEEGYAARTVLVWIVFFANLMSLYLLGYWLATVLHLSGLRPEQAVFAASMQQAGGVLSTLLLGPLSDRLGAERVLTVSFGLGVLFIGAIGLLNLPYLGVLVAIFGAGACTIGSQLGANAMAGILYPARMRSTGVGWALGIGRFGAIAGPALGGLLLGFGWPPKQIFLCACLTALIAACATAALRLKAPAGAQALQDA